MAKHGHVGSAVDLKPPSTDVPLATLLTAGCVPGSYTVTLYPVCPTISITFTDGSTATYTAKWNECASGSAPFTLSQTDQITGLSVTATGGTF